MTRRLFALLVAMVMVLGLGVTAYGEEAGPEPAEEPVATEEPAATEEPTAAQTPAPTEEPAAEQEAEPPQAPAETQAPEAAEPSAEPSDAPGEELSPEPDAAPGEEQETAQQESAGEPAQPQQAQGTEGPSLDGQITPSAAPGDGLPQQVQDEMPADRAEDGGDALAADGTADGEDEPTALAEGLAVTVTGNDTGRTLTTAEGEPFQSGDTLTADPQGGYGLKLSPAGKGVAVYDEEQDVWFCCDPASGLVTLHDIDGDGKMSISLVSVERFALTIENETGAALTLSGADGTEVKSGEAVYYENASMRSVDLTAALDKNYTIQAGSAGDYVYYDLSTNTLTISDDGDGAVTIQVTERQKVKLVIRGAADKATFTDRAGKTVQSGDMVYLDETLYVTVASGYGIPGGSRYTLYATADGRYEFDLCAKPGSEVVVTVNAYCKLHMEGDGLILVAQDSFFASDHPVAEGGQMLIGEHYYVTVKSGYAIQVTGGTASLAPDLNDGYYLDTETGQVVRVYDLVPDGSGPVTVKAAASKEKVPGCIKVAFVDPEGAIAYGAKYVWPGDDVVYSVKDGYTLSVKGGTVSHAFADGEGETLNDFAVEIDDKAAAVTITAVKLSGGAALKVSGSQSALLAKDQDGTAYLVDGDKLPGGYGFVLVRSGYAITGAKGGKVEFHDGLCDRENPGTGEIYSVYYVEAHADTVTVTVEKAKANRWIKVDLVNYFDDDVMAYARTASDEDGSLWAAILPADGGQLYVDLAAMYGGDVAQYTLAVQGGSVVKTQVYGQAGVCGYTIDPGNSNEITVTVVKKDLQPKLEALAPGKPAAGVPGVPDKAAAEKRLLEEAAAVVSAALRGERTAGVSEQDAAAIAQAAAEGKTITTQLVVTAVTAPADAAALQTAAGSDTITQYIDVQIVVLADGQPVGHITQTKKTVDLAVVLSDQEMEQGMIFYVLRSHNGGTGVLPARLSGNVLRFASDQFSTFAVASTNDIAYADVGPIADRTYTGSAIRPSVEVTANGRRALKQGVDYTLSYENNVNKGTATVVITGIGAYSGTKKVTFAIVAPAAAAAKVGTAPPTGDETPLALSAGVLALCLGGLALALRRKKRAEK